MRPPVSAIEPFLDTLRQAPFVRGVRLASDGEVERILVETTRGVRRLLPIVERSHLSYAAMERLAASLPAKRSGIIVLAPYVGAAMARRLADEGIPFADPHGNLFLSFGAHLTAFVTGQRAAAAPVRDRALRAAGYQAVFGLLVEPGLAGATARAFAELAGVSRSTANLLLRKLIEEQCVVPKAKRPLVRREALLDRFARGYAETLRPSLFVGRFQPPTAEPAATEVWVAKRLEGAVWRWGGTAAAHRLVGHYRGPLTTLHLREGDVPMLRATMARRLGALPSPEGGIEVLCAPGPLAFDGPDAACVHPLLVWAEALRSPDERAREAARVVYERWVKDAP